MKALRTKAKGGRFFGTQDTFRPAFSRLRAVLIESKMNETVSLIKEPSKYSMPHTSASQSSQHQHLPLLDCDMAWRGAVFQLKHSNFPLDTLGPQSLESHLWTSMADVSAILRPKKRCILKRETQEVHHPGAIAQFLRAIGGWSTPTGRGLLYVGRPHKEST